MINYVLDIEAGGIFSKYMFAIQNGVKHKFDSIYLNVIDDRTISNAFDFVLDQQYQNDCFRIKCENLGTYDKSNPIETSENFNNYQNFVNLLKIKQSILDEVETYVKELNINKNTVGVHLRLTDMNIHHVKQYGVLSFEDFVSNMDISKEYFVASDNHESIQKLKNIFGDKIKFIPKMIRCENEYDDSTTLQLSNFRNERFWVEAFIEMLILSKCNTIICRTSNLINASILHSKTINKIIRL
jgi:hypothetical protein